MSLSDSKLAISCRTSYVSRVTMMFPCADVFATPSLFQREKNQRVLLQKTCLCFLTVVFLLATLCETSAQNATPYLAPMDDVPVNASSPYVHSSNSESYISSNVNPYTGNRTTLRLRPRGQSAEQITVPSVTQQPQPSLQIDIRPRSRAVPSVSYRTPLENYQPENYQRQPVTPMVAPVTIVPTTSATQAYIPPPPPSQPIISVKSAPIPSPSVVAPIITPTPPRSTLPANWYEQSVPSPTPIPTVAPLPVTPIDVIQPDKSSVYVGASPEPVASSDVNVTFYDPSQAGAKPALDAPLDGLKVDADYVPPSPTPEPKNLTSETSNILTSLPRDLFPATATRQAKGGFNVDRNNPESDIPSGADFSESMSVGANVSVKRQNIDVSYELEKAYNALLQGSTDVAINIYKDVLAFDSTNKNAMFGLATTYHKLGMLAQARPLYGRLLEIDPYNKEVLNNFLAMVGEEAPESAILYLEQLKSANSEFSPIYAQLAQLYAKANDIDNAINNMQQATAMSPENLIYTYNLAVLFDTKKDYRRAEVLYSHVLRSGLEGKEIPASMRDIQERLIFLGSK